MKDTTTEFVFDHPLLGPTPITKIYYGADRNCRCGCGGEYFVPGDEGFDAKCKRFLHLAKTYDFASGDYDLDAVYANIRTSRDPNLKPGVALCAYFD